MNQGKLVILSGQSGVGKNTILKRLLEKHADLCRVVTFTTRDPRPNEIPGEDHFFVYPEKFEEMIKNNEFIEYARVHNEWWGTPKKQIDNILKRGEKGVMEIDVQGATKIKKLIPESILIFIKYEGEDIAQSVRRRIEKDTERGKTAEVDIQERIETARKEALYEKDYDYSVVNPEGKAEEAVERIEQIIQNIN